MNLPSYLSEKKDLDRQVKERLGSFLSLLAVIHSHPY